MDFRFGHLCDYATQGANGKAILVGVFDQIINTGNAPVRLPLCFLVFKLECSIAEGGNHRIQFRLKDGEEVTLKGDDGSDLDFDLGTQNFSPSGPGRGRNPPVRGQGPRSGLTMPNWKDLLWQMLADTDPRGYTYDDAARVLRRLGFEERKGRGSHRLWRLKPSGGNVVYIGLVQKGHGTLKPGYIRDMVNELRTNGLIPLGTEGTTDDVDDGAKD